MNEENEGNPQMPCYAVFIRKHGEWVMQSIPMGYAEAQEHAKIVRRGMAFVEKTRVRRIPHNT